jgi:uncharacterized protein
VVENSHRRLEESPGIEILLETSLSKIEAGSEKRCRLCLNSDARFYAVEADFVVLAGGKLSTIWLAEFLDRLGIACVNNSRFSLGFRVEALGRTLNPVSGGCEDPKIRVTEGAVATETFCWRKNGGVIAYDFGGAKLLDGERAYGKPRENSSFGIITTVELSRGASKTLTPIAFSRFINAVGERKALLQRFGDSRNQQATSDAALQRDSVTSSLKEFRLCNLRSYYPSVGVNGFLKRVEEINRRFPCTIDGDALIYAPIIESIFPDVELSRDLETNRLGLFLVGDCSGKGVGVAPAVVMGLVAARRIKASHRERQNKG